MQSLHTVLSLLPMFRPYKDLVLAPAVSKETVKGGKGNKDNKNTAEDEEEADALFDQYVDQLTLVFNLVHVLSSYGELW